jgi:hypothetical protein
MDSDQPEIALAHDLAIDTDRPPHDAALLNMDE